MALAFLDGASRQRRVSVEADQRPIVWLDEVVPNVHLMQHFLEDDIDRASSIYEGFGYRVASHHDFHH